MFSKIWNDIPTEARVILVLGAAIAIFVLAVGTLTALHDESKDTRRLRCIEMTQDVKQCGELFQ